jgi:hypothetical protein
VLAEKPPIKSETLAVSEDLLNELMQNIGTLASVTFQSPSLLGKNSYVDMTQFTDGQDENRVGIDVLRQTATVMGTGNLIENLLDLDFNEPALTTNASPGTQIDLLGDVDLLNDTYDNPGFDTFISADAADGFELKGSFTKAYKITNQKWKYLYGVCVHEQKSKSNV